MRHDGFQCVGSIAVGIPPSLISVLSVLISNSIVVLFSFENPLKINQEVSRARTWATLKHFRNNVGNDQGQGQDLNSSREDLKSC